jgi:membrane protease YdiL (CAAX protease family)
MRAFWLALPILWTTLAIAGYFYSQQQGIPIAKAAAVIAAALAEAAFYLAMGFDAVRERLRALGPAFMIGSAIVPYAIYAGLSGTFQWTSFLLLVLLSIVLSLWYRALPRRPTTDIAFLLLVAAVYMSPLFRWIYVSTIPRVPMDLLGRLTWSRLGIMAALLIRQTDRTGFGFIPTRKEWRIGVLHFLYFLPVGIAIGYWLEFARFRDLPAAPWKMALVGVATFIGFMWVTGLIEEFFFRGLLQQWMRRWLHTESGALVLTSILFGMVHLPFGRTFPNWRFAILGAIAGLFYGRAFAKARSVRASTVTHSLVVTTWRVFFN